MNRFQRRRAEKQGKFLLSKKQLAEHEDAVRQDISAYNVEALMTCFALAERRLYGFGQTRIARTLNYIDELMEPVIDGTVTIEDYKKILEEEAGVEIKCTRKEV